MMPTHQTGGRDWEGGQFMDNEALSRPGAVGERKRESQVGINKREETIG